MLNSLCFYEDDAPFMKVKTVKNKSKLLELTWFDILILLMIIHSSLTDRFCQRVQFSHATNIIEQTPQVTRFLRTFSSNLSKRKLASRNFSSKKVNNFNRYYINPEQRYHTLTLNPKQDKVNLQNDRYLYQHLHDAEFNNWKHPLETKTKMTQPKGKKAISVGVTDLDKEKLRLFREYSERKKTMRLPHLVQELLSPP